MSTTPPPPGDDTDGSKWREGVLQSYRNEEARAVAKVLAALEPGATPSTKLMLAMRFEESIFKAASSLSDYRKKLTKRLKKLQKNYVPPAEPQKSDPKSDKDALLLDLKRKYGPSLLYISKNSEAAIKDVQERSGSERATQLRQHTDSAMQWAKDLGLAMADSGTTDSTKNTTVSDTAPKASEYSEAQLQKLQQHLERRVANIRQYVVKHADPDLFLQETLERKDKETPARANKLLGVNLSKRIQQLQKTTNATSATPNEAAPPFNLMTMLQESLEKAQTTVPPPTRNNDNNIPAALLHLDKMRAASTALMSYFAIPERQMTAPRDVLSKTSDVASEGIEFVQSVAAKLPKPDKNQVSLQDAWTKVLELPSLVEEPTVNSPAKTVNTASSELDASAPEAEPVLKKQRLSPVAPALGPPVTKSRVLLTPNRKTPSNLIPAIKRKRATLIRPPHGSKGSHLILEFGQAFSMTIYFCPLLVSIRAMEPPEENSQASTAKPKQAPTTLTTQGCATWKPLHFGLTHYTGPATANTSGSQAQRQQRQQPESNGKSKSLKVWGVEGSYESLGSVVESRLEDASLHATQVLRKCFRNHVKDKTLDFEVEILEASALLEFLHLARTTFMPHWQDDDS